MLIFGFLLSCAIGIFVVNKKIRKLSILYYDIESGQEVYDFLPAFYCNPYGSYPYFIG